MKEDLALYGNQLNYFTTYFKCVLTAFSFSNLVAERSHSIGYMIMLYPSCIIISHIGPSVWLPAMEVSLDLLPTLHLE
jgi:ACS family pantothenate transporter-like MFS transporter